MISRFFDLWPQLFSRIADASVRGAIVLLAALVLTYLLRRRSAATRHAIWVGAIAAQLLLLVLGVSGLRWRVAIPDSVSALLPPITAEQYAAPIARSAAPPATRAPMVDSTMTVTQQATVSVASAGETLATPRGARVSGRTILAVLWALGALVVLLRLAIGTTMVARLARRGDRIDDGSWLTLAQRLSTALSLRRPLILMRGDRVGVPITWGIVYPIVLLPEDADQWPEERRRFVLVHEMAHVKRLDALTQLVGQLALALFWFDPLVWIANRRMQLEREHACDDYVLRHGTQPSQYANELLEMVLALGTPSHRGAQPAFAALAMARRSEFEGRVLSILDPVLDRHPLSRGRTLMSALASLLIVVPLAALQPYRSQAQSQASSPSSSSSSSPSQASATADTSITRSRSATTESHASASATQEPPFGKRLDTLDSARSALGVGVNGVAKARATIRTSTSNANTNDAYSCDAARFDGSSNTLQNREHDNGVVTDIRSVHLTGSRCVEVRIHGTYTMSPTEDQVVALGPSSRVYVRERTPSLNREVTYIAAAGGGSNIALTYRVNGAEAPFDDAARRWVASILPDVLAEMSINVKPRVARWRSAGGVDGALRHISDLRSSGAKRSHLEALLEEKQLSSAEAGRVVQQAGREIPSSGDLRSVLSKAAPQVRSKTELAPAFEEAVSSVASSGDRKAVLAAYGQTDDRNMLLVVMKIASTIPSSGDKANLLSELAPRYLAKNDAALRDAFFATAETIPSSGDLASVLDDVIPFAKRSNDVALELIETSYHVAGSGDRSGVLITMADSGAVRAQTARDAYLNAAKHIPASGDMRRVLEALPRQ